MLDAAHGVGIRTVPSIQRVDVARIEVQVACADTAGGSGRRRPVVALGADAAQSTRLTVAVTRSRGFITIAGLNVPEEFGSSGTDWDAELACEPPPADCGIYPTALTEAVASGSRRAVRRRVFAASDGSETALQMLDAAHSKTVGTVRSVQRVHVARVEVQVARVDAAGGVGRRGPVIPVRADARQGSRLTIAAARSSRNVVWQSLD